MPDSPTVGCSPSIYVATAPLVVANAASLPTGNDRQLGMHVWQADTGQEKMWDGTGWIIMDEPDQAFNAYSVASSSGTITTVGAKVGRYKRRGGWCTFSTYTGITTNGTGSGAIVIGLPVAALASGQVIIGAGRDMSTVKQMSVAVTSGASTAILSFYDGAYPGSSGAALAMSIEYPMATRYS